MDEFSRFTYVEPTTTKGEASQAVLRFVKRFERQTGHTVRSLHTDGGKEFHLAREKLREEGVYTTKTTAYTPQSNGLPERSHGIILTIARAALLQANLPFSYWDYAVQHVAKGKNFVIHSTTRDVPYDAAHGHPSSDLKYHKPFGCRMLYHPVVSKLPTFAPRLQEGICLGHSGGGLYTVLTTNGMATTKHVQAFENEFPGLSIISSVPAPPDSGDAEESGFVEIPLPPPHLADDNDPQPLPNDPDSSAESASDGYTNPDDGGDDMDNMLTHIPPVPSSFGDSQDDNLEEYSRPPRLRQIGRVNYTYKALPAALSTADEPKLSVALRSCEHDHWKQAIQEEFDNLINSDTWEPDKSPPPTTRILPSGVILRLKRDEEGHPKRFKAHLVARGNFQDNSVDYTELYAPVACVETIRFLLSIAASNQWSAHHVDVKALLDEHFAYNHFLTLIL